MADERKRLTAHDLALRVQRRGLDDLLDRSQPFKRFCWTILIEAGIFAPTYRQGSPHDTSYWEGRRALGLEVLHILKAVRPDILALLEAEGSLLTKQVQDEQQQTPGEPYADDDQD